MDDQISRQAAIDTIRKIILGFFSDADGVMTDTEKTLLSVNKAICNELAKLPSAQPETHEKRTETHSCDCISRQAAIDAILAVTGNSSVRELYEHVQEHELSDMWSGGVVAAIDTIIALPSAQPSPCEFCKHNDTSDDVSCLRCSAERRTDEGD